MRELFLHGLSILYGIAGIICCIAYLPTIRDLYLYKKGSANVTTYMLWTISALITSLYSFFILQDNLFRIISVLNFVLCTIILYLRFNLSSTTK